MEVFFCDRCARRVTQGDVKEGRAVMTAEGCFCRKCAKAESSGSVKAVARPRPLSPLGLPAAAGLMSTREAREAPTRPRLRPSHVHRRRARDRTGAFVLLLLMGGLAGFAAAYLLLERTEAPGIDPTWVRLADGAFTAHFFTGKRPGGRLEMVLPGSGSWTVELNGKKVFSGRVLSKTTVKLGKAVVWLCKGKNECVAICDERVNSNGRTDPPVLRLSK